MTSEDPWVDLVAPQNILTVNARRIDQANPWDFYWARDYDGRCLLVLRHGAASSPTSQLPNLRGIEISLHPPDAKAKPSLVLRLLDGTLREIFHRLCLDLIATASAAKTELDAVATLLARTWRWHHLLRGGGSGILSREEQKGLIGELIVLDRYLLPTLGPSAALAAWRGPLGGAKDFVASRTGIESKARSTIDPARLAISSQFQLDRGELESLFLHVSVVDGSLADSDDGFTLTDAVVRLRKALAVRDELLAIRFDALAAAAGFAYEHDYAGDRWINGSQTVYRVTDAFLA